MNKKKPLERIALLSVCHMGIDFLCAFSLYRCFSDRYEAFLLYNFCAFALQMPLGILIDLWSKNSKKTMLPGMMFTFAGIILTILGSFVSHILLGIGNAFFHVGGGVLTIHDDDFSQFKGKGLGTFVAPGAIGLILGSLYYDSERFMLIRLMVSAGLLVMAYLLYRDREERMMTTDEISWEGNKELPMLILACFIVVILRSLTGLAISFPWKTDKLITIISVLCLAAGKTAGGFLSAYLGMRKTVILTLVVSMITYAFADQMGIGLLALFAFNMTMPLTLYLLAGKMKQMPGFAFGILTFGLFLGYLPVLYGYLRGLPPFPFGSLSSLLSLIILYFAVRLARET